MPALKCHFDGEVTAETGSGLFVESSDIRKEAKTKENRERRGSIWGGNGGGGLKFFEWKGLGSRQSEAP
jgi:hypothetical protein